MKTNEIKTTDVISSKTSTIININSLSQEFNNDSFYGLEYIIDDFFQDTSEKTTPQSDSSFIDWFGLYN